MQNLNERKINNSTIKFVFQQMLRGRMLSALIW